MDFKVPKKFTDKFRAKCKEQREAVLSNGVIKKQLAAAEKAPELLVICGVYILMNDDEPVYVGKSISIFSRVLQHREQDQLDFNDVLFIKCSKKSLDSLEKSVQLFLLPRLCGDHHVKVLRGLKFVNGFS